MMCIQFIGIDGVAKQVIVGHHVTCHFQAVFKQNVCAKNTVGLNLHTETMRNRFAVTQILNDGQIPPVCAKNPILFA